MLHLFRLISSCFAVIAAFCDREEITDVAEGSGDGIEGAGGAFVQKRLEF